MAPYRPFGRTLTQPTNPALHIGYTGHDRTAADTALNLVYMNARYYMPGSGRAASAVRRLPDPTGERRAAQRLHLPRMHRGRHRLLMRSLAAALKERALDLGFNLVGVVSAEPARRLDAYLAWIAAQMYGAMDYLARPDRVARRRDLNVILPGARALVCVGLEYATAGPPPELTADPARGRISNYAWGVDYHAVMTPRLQALADWLAVQSDAPVRSRVYVDTGAILERDHAETAGLGFTGKNTMLIHPRRGSFLFLGELLTTLPLPPDPPAAPMPSCGRCTRCLTACPTAAFPRPYVLDARRCISYLTIELKGWIPRDMRPLLGNWVYGCDICQEVCPFNRFASPAAEALFQPADLAAAAPPLVDLLALDEAGFRARYGVTPLGRIGRARLARNACVAAGNWGDPHVVPPLTALLGDADPYVRGHAAWALGRSGRRDGLAAVAAALAQETDAAVREELAAALAP